MPAPSASAPGSPAPLPEFSTLLVRRHKLNTLVITLNRPQVYNALSPQVYDEWLAAMHFAASDPHTHVVVITGAGPVYTAGQQLEPPPASEAANLRAYYERRVLVTKSLVDSFITHPKLIVVAVNGPALGIGVTTMVLADLIYAVPHATFKTPFMDLSLCVEGCSSVTFPRALGVGKASDMLFLGRTMTAQEWEQAGLVTEILPAEGFMDAVLSKAEQAAKYSPVSVQGSVKLIRDIDRKLLLETNEKELKLLVE
eukprot:jgi/Hompol1/5133/HPOL_004172-RA